MPGFPAQFDYEAGLDITGDTSVDQSELMQMVNQITPLNNIGGVLYDSGAGSTFPDVSLNSRFNRYLWIDTQTVPHALKMWDGTGNAYDDWVAVGVTTAGVTSTHIAVDAVAFYEADGTTKRVAYAKGVTIEQAAGRILRVDAGGDQIEAVSLVDILAENLVPLVALDVSTKTNGQYLRVNSSRQVEAQTLNLASELGVGSIPPSSISGGGNVGWLLRVDSTGVKFESVSNIDSTSNLFPAGSIGLSKLVNSASSSIIRHNGTNWAAVVPALDLGNGATISNNGLPGILLSVFLAGNNVNFTHGLGAVPKLFRLFVQCNNVAGSAGYAFNEQIPLEDLFTANTNAAPAIKSPEDTHRIYGVSLTSSFIAVKRYAIGMQVFVVDINGQNRTRIDNVAADWDIKCFAWA